MWCINWCHIAFYHLTIVTLTFHVIPDIIITINLYSFFLFCLAENSLPRFSFNPVGINKLRETYKQMFSSERPASLRRSGKTTEIDDTASKTKSKWFSFILSYYDTYYTIFLHSYSLRLNLDTSALGPSAASPGLKGGMNFKYL